MSTRLKFTFVIFLARLVCATSFAQTASAATDADAWLRYTALDPKTAKQYEHLPSKIAALGDSPLLQNAAQELTSGIEKMTGRTLSANGEVRGSSFVLATVNQAKILIPALSPPSGLTGDGYWITRAKVQGFECFLITSNDDRGVLYGVFGLLRKIAQGQGVARIDELQQPAARIRWIDQWDNLDGSVERGYGGRSIFFEGGKVREDLTRAGQYARLLASIGITTCTVNNVNAAPGVLADSLIPQIRRIAEVFWPWGV
jgi:alpha-glucuronidase